jgi:putative transposase
MRFAWIKNHVATDDDDDDDDDDDASNVAATAAGSTTAAVHAGWPVAVLCDVLAVSRSGYYAWRQRPASARAARRAELVEQVRAAHTDSRGTYGSPRVHAELSAAGVSVCENTVAKIMRQAGVRSITAKRFRCRTTDSAHAHPIAPNVLDRDFAAELPDRKWAADISYVETGQGWLYVAVVIDLCTRRIVGWAMADHLRAELCTDALSMALGRRNPKAGAGLVHHSDRGCQYACGAYRELLTARGITCSMSRSGDCYDNAVAESFWGTLKTELVYPSGGYATRAQATASIFEWIECWYNRKRRHSALGYKSPEEFEAELN